MTSMMMWTWWIPSNEQGKYQCKWREWITEWVGKCQHWCKKGKCQLWGYWDHKKVDESSKNKESNEFGDNESKTIEKKTKTIKNCKVGKERAEIDKDMINTVRHDGDTGTVGKTSEIIEKCEFGN